MSRKVVRDCMTKNPVTIPADLSLADAAERMYEHGIRHLPVVDKDHVIGIVSERDLALVTGIPGVVANGVEVVEAMSANPYIVPPETSLEEVVRVMHERKIGTAVVMEPGDIQGIFSVIDALELLLMLLRGDNE